MTETTPSHAPDQTMPPDARAPDTAHLQRPYAMAGVCWKTDRQGSTEVMTYVGTVTADSEEAAYGLAMRELFKRYPTAEGHVGHYAHLMLLSRDVLQIGLDAYAALAAVRGAEGQEGGE